MAHQYLSALNAGYIESLLEAYRADPNAVEPSWNHFFDGFSFAKQGLGDQKAPAEGPALSIDALEHEVKVIELIQGYREMAYLIADVDPLDRSPKQHPLLSLENFGLKPEDLDRVTEVGRLVGLGPVPLRDIISALKAYYCSPIAVEISHIEDPESRHWVQKRVESKKLLRPLREPYKLRALEKLVQAELFETFVHKRFVGQKRFSIEGSDVLIPALDYLLDQAGSLGADEVILGMAHRGRLNVLANIFEKELRSIFAEFSGNLQATPNASDGDVKYHMGYSLDTKTMSGKDIHISLAPNPSHLEAINSVVMGITRSKQKLKGDQERNQVLAVLLHGDASFAGQGSVYEVLNMSNLDGYTVGGVIHIIVNNQIGFTTNPKDSRSTPYATDIAKMLEIPIFRVNADEPEAVLRCIAMAVQFRYTFKRDVVIDLVGYRRYGHNEGDEPTFTQPLLYQKINAHPRVKDSYSKRLVQQGFISQEHLSTVESVYLSRCEAALKEAKANKVSPQMASFGKRWTGFVAVPANEDFFKPADTAVSLELLQTLGSGLLALPDGFSPHPKISRMLEDRKQMVEGKRDADWSLAESFAFATLLCEGSPVRLAGQDCMRGTFSHRHVALFDANTGARHIPLNHLSCIKSDFEVVNSLLSEMGALGFEFGQSSANPKKLTLWEAQFGDFMNGAQIIIDQFITCSAFKWQRSSGLVLLLPHGYEGQGPEHSSARLERFLQACAQQNIQVCNLTTPAQYFHVLRRQLKRPFRVPLIIMSPKSLLRNPLAVSPLADFERGGFSEFLDDPDARNRRHADRLILCSGKIFYELLEGRNRLADHRTAILRVEQFYPFHKAAFLSLLAQYPEAKQIVWCQEEPQNMGGWNFMMRYIDTVMERRLPVSYAGRPPQASPAHGFTHIHHEEQAEIVKQALGAI